MIYICVDIQYKAHEDLNESRSRTNSNDTTGKP